MINHGWRAAFYFSAGVGVVAALVWYVIARDRPQDHANVSPSELAYIKAGLPVAGPGQSPPVPWNRIFTSRDIWLLVVAYSAFGYVAFIFLTWFFIYLAEGRHLNLQSKPANLRDAAFHRHDKLLSGGRVISDWLCRVKGQYVGRSVYGAFTLLLTAVFLVIGSHAQSTLGAVLALAGGAGAVYLGQSCYWAVAADCAGPFTGVVSGLLKMGCQLAGALTASMTPYLASKFGWSSAFYVAAAVALVCAFAWLGVNPKTRLDTAEGQVEA